MQLPQIIHAGVYRHPQNGFQIAQRKWISFSVSGLLQSEKYYPDHTLARAFDIQKDPFVPHMALIAPDFFLRFRYNEKRENWVTMFESEDVIYQNEAHQFYLREGDILLPIPEILEVERSEVEEVRSLFERMNKLYHSAIPSNILSAELLLASLFLRFLQPPGERDDPVERFRKKIEADKTCMIPLDEHCRELGYSRDYLRREFIRRYKISPVEYRIRRRLQLIIHYCAHTDWSLKEIAYAVGMKNVTHLNQLVGRYYGKTPSELCYEYRVVNSDRQGGMHSGTEDRMRRRDFDSKN